jgi:regulator of sigma E protease
MFSNLPAFLILIGVVVTIHELGHFLAAKYCGVGVLKFSVGFGPAIWKKMVKGTEYQISIIPLGGFVRMVGDMPDMITGEQVSDAAVRNGNDDSEEEKPEKEKVPVHPDVQAMLDDQSQWFINKNNWQKSLIVFAGPLFNFILAIQVVMFSTTVYGLLDVDGTKMGKVLSGSPAEEAGLLEGDEILSISGTHVETFEGLQKMVQDSKGEVLQFVLKRGEREESLDIVPKVKATTTIAGERVSQYMIGVAPALTPKPVPFIEGIGRSFTWVGTTSYLVIDGLVGLFRGKVSMDSLGGPILIYQVAGERASEGVNSYLIFLAYINITLGILNLLPIPVLDGGHLLMFAFEGLFGTVSIKKKEMIQALGFSFIIGIMVIAVYNDLTRDMDSLKEKEPAWSEEE